MTSQPEPNASAGNPYVMDRDRLEADMSQIAQWATSDSSLAFEVASGEIASGKTRLIPPLLWAAVTERDHELLVVHRTRAVDVMNTDEASSQRASLQVSERQAPPSYKLMVYPYAEAATMLAENIDMDSAPADSGRTEAEDWEEDGKLPRGVLFVVHERMGGIWVFLEILVAALDYYMGHAPDAQPPGNVLVADGTILINFAGVMAIARTMETTQTVLSESGVSCAGDLAKLSQEDVQAFLGDFCQCFIDQLTLAQYEGEGHRARDLTNRRRVISDLKNSLFWPDLEKTIENIGTNGTAYGIANCYDVVTESPVAQAISWTFVPSTIVERWYWMDLEISQGYGHPTL